VYENVVAAKPQEGSDHEELHHYEAGYLDQSNQLYFIWIISSLIYSFK